MRIVYKLDVPVVATAAVPTTDDIAITNVVDTVCIERPCIHVVAVEEPEIVLTSALNVNAVTPLYIAIDPAEAKLVS
jgi:hypothetical protein